MQPAGYVRFASPDLDAMFAALADPTRRAILERLAAGEASVTELAEPFEMSQPAISKHLKVLERAGLVSRGRGARGSSREDGTRNDVPENLKPSGWRKPPTGWSATARPWKATSSVSMRCS